ncbi:MAG: helix-turn-helix transcriptional regulator [Lachnospiraceae bacterium]|nr:helix-turn-helix transcriptional regulator [Lachnospiraceae bacterium]
MKTIIIDNIATSNRLRRKFAECGFKPKDVQSAMQLESVQAVYKWINPKNKTIPSTDSIMQLAYLMNCTVEDIIVTREIEL